MDFFLQHSINSTVLSAIAIAVVAIQAQPKNKIFSFEKMIEKSLFLKKFYFAILFLDFHVSPKALFGCDSLSKTLIEK